MYLLLIYLKIKEDFRLNISSHLKGICTVLKIFIWLKCNKYKNL